MIDESKRTPADPRVVDAILDEFMEEYGEVLDRLGKWEDSPITIEDLVERVIGAINSEDETERELVKDFTDLAMKYTTIRYQWNYYSREEKLEQDAYRTSVHNRLIDALNIFCRYEMSIGKQAPDFDGRDRKDIGDMANKLICMLAIRER